MDRNKLFNIFPKKTLIALTIAGLISCGGKTPQEHLSEAEQYYKDRDIQSAIIELKNSLKQQQEFAEARALLGVIYAETGRPADAEKELKRSLEYGMSFELVADALTDVMLSQRKAKQLIEDFSITPEDSDTTLALKSIALGESHLQIGDYETAERFFTIATEHQRVRQNALLGLSQIALINSEPVKAEQLVNDAIELAPKNAKAWITKANIFMTLQNNEEAETALQKTIQFSGSKHSQYYQIGMRQLLRLQLGRGDTESAQSVLDKLKGSFPEGKFPNDPFLSYLRSSLAYQNQDFINASLLANQVLMADNNNLGAKLLIGLSDSRLGKYVQAETHLQSFVALVPDHDQARKMLALVQTQTKNPEQALETLAPLNEKIDELDHATLALLAQTSYLAGRSDQSTLYLQKALKKAPDDPKLNFALAQTLTAQNDYEQALDVLSSLEGTTEQKQQALFTQAQIHIRAKKYNDAIQILDGLIEALPDNPAPLVLKGGIYFTQGLSDSARNYFQSALTINSLYIPALRSLALIELKNGNTSNAESVYLSALENNSPNEATKAQLLLDFSQLLLRQQKFSEAEQQLVKAKSIKPAELQSSVLLARLYLNQRQPHLAKEQLLEHAEKNLSPVLNVLGSAHMMSKEFNSALELFRKLSLLEPGSPSPNYLVATAQIQLGDTEGAKRSLHQSLAISPGYLPALQTSVNLAIQQLEFSDAHDALEKLKLSAPEHPSATYLEADLAMAENNPALAAALYQKLYQSTPDNALRQKLVGALEKSGEPQKAVKILEDDTTKEPGDAHAHLLLASLYMGQNNTEGAINRYRQVIKLDKDQALALNNLAWLLRDTVPEEAVTFARRAHKLLPENADIRDTLDQIETIIKGQ